MWKGITAQGGVGPTGKGPWGELSTQVSDGGRQRERERERTFEIGKMVLLLRTLAAEPGSVLSTYMVAHNCLKFQFQGIQCPLQSSVRTRHTCGAYQYMQENT